jgi:hypothetical protein
MIVEEKVATFKLFIEVDNCVARFQERGGKGGDVGVVDNCFQVGPDVSKLP